MKSGILTALLGCAALFGQTPPAANPGNVTLPLEEYNRLTDLAAKSPAISAAAPVPFAIQSADIKVEVKGDTATAAIALEGELFATGAVRVPMTKGMVVVDAQRAGAELPLEYQNSTQYAILEGPGPFSINLNAVFRVTIEAGRASFQLPAPPAGAVRIALTIPGERTDVIVNPGLITNRSADGSHALVEATLPPGQTATVSWTTHDAGTAEQAQTPKEVRFLSGVKTLVTVGETQISLATLADITVVQGDPSEFAIRIPAGYEVTASTGASLVSSETKDGALLLKVADPKARSHQFLISFERAVEGSKAEVAIPAFRGSQRDTGEVAVEGEGALELTAKEAGRLKRMDLKEASPFLIGLSQRPIRAAFRYHRQDSEAAALNLEWQRFPNSAVTAAIADTAYATTLVTSDGKTLTEVKLTVRNHSQPFLKVGLPAGASILTAEVGGQAVKPVVAADGNRIPLLRAGFHPTGAYVVSFVFLHAGAPFAKKGGSELDLPKMDLPVAVVHWELFLPDRYKVKDFGGDVVADQGPLPLPHQPAANPTMYPLAADTGGRALLNNEPLAVMGGTTDAQDVGGFNGGSLPGGRGGRAGLDAPLIPGQLAGIVVDPAGATVPNARVRVFNNATGQTIETTSGPDGAWRVAGLTDGRLRVMVNSPGFNEYYGVMEYSQSHPVRLRSQLNIGSVNETVEVRAEAATVNTESSMVSEKRREKKEKDALKTDDQASANVLNLQQRVAGVLPIRIDVPRAGHSFRFVRPLVVDENTKVTFTYRSQ